jgi:hypothetical protein
MPSAEITFHKNFPVLIVAARLDYFGFAYDSFKIQIEC